MSAAPGSDDGLIEFYSSGYRESSRLERPKSRLEFLRAQELLRDRLPAVPARILDVGGGTGAHAAWLAGDGYGVTLVDLVPAHVDAALELAARLEDGFAARVGDARDLEAADGSVDACLLFGPLYHLPDPSDRSVALAEAVRVTRPGGVVCAVAISRYAWPLYALRDGDRLTPERVASIAATFASGQRDPVGRLPVAFSHTPDELGSELKSSGLTAVEVLGIEGPGWPLFTPDLAESRANDLLGDAIAAARLCDGHPEMSAVSAHLLACGRRS